MSIKEEQKEVIEEFELLPDWDSKYEYIMDLGRKLPKIDEQYLTDEYKVKGCQSNVWLNAEMEDGKVVYTAESEALIVKGLVYLLIRVLSHRSPEEIVHADLFFIEDIGMSRHLAQTRSNGLRAMLKQMKLYALAHQSQEQNVEE